MKLQLLCLAVIVLFSAVQAGLTDEQRARLNKINNECKTEAQTTDNEIEKLRVGSLDETDAKLRAHIWCLSKKIGLQNANGELQVETIKKELGRPLNPTQLEAAVALCAIKKATPEETAFHLWKCWRVNVFDKQKH